MSSLAKKGKGKAGKKGKGKAKPFKVSIKIVPTDEVYTLPAVRFDMTIAELKKYAELITGIPTFMQRIRYLDEGDLMDNTTLRENEIVPGCNLHMTVWSMWTTMLQAIAMADLPWLLKLGVFRDSDYRTPNIQYTYAYKRNEIFEERGEVALFMAAARGRFSMCKALIENGVDVNGETEKGRTALHVAAAQNHGNIIDLLLEKGADVDMEDDEGNTALGVAAQFDHKGCEQHLFMFRWQQRAKKREPPVKRPDFSFQKVDSGKAAWLTGKVAQVYLTSDLLKPQEFQGTALHAPKSVYKIKTPVPEEEAPSPDNEEVEADRDGQLGIIHEEHHTRTKAKKDPSKIGQLSFATWLQQKEAKEEVEMARLREERRVKKMAEEDRKKAEEMKTVMAEKSYDQWVAEREAANKKQKKEAKVQAMTGGKSTQDIIHGLLLKHQAEEGFHGLPFEIWAAERTGKMFHQIKTHGDILSQHYEVLP